MIKSLLSCQLYFYIKIIPTNSYLIINEYFFCNILIYLYIIFN